MKTTHPSGKAYLLACLMMLGAASHASGASEDPDYDPGSDWQSKFNFNDEDETPAPDLRAPANAVDAAAPATTPSFEDDARQDIVLRTANYLHAYRLPLRASVHIHVDEARGLISSAEAAQAQQLITAYAQGGLLDRAAYLETKLSSGWDVTTLNHFWLARARQMLSRAEPQLAELALRRLRPPIDSVLSGQRQSLLQLAYIAQGRFDAVITSFEQTEGDPEQAMQAYYNYAVSLSRQGRRNEALALLDELGEVKALSNEMLALQDRANLALAWAWLADNQGASARAVFKRIGLERGGSGQALLGLGWSELAPDGKRQETRFRRKLNCVDALSLAETTEERIVQTFSPCRPIETAPMFKYYRLFDFDAGGVGADRVRRAMRPWLVLAQRGAHEPAVQEALLALAYAHTRLRQYDEAAQAYRIAIRHYEDEIRRLDSLETELGKPGIDVQGLLLRRARSNEFLSVRSSHDFASAAADLDDLLAAGFDLTGIGRKLNSTADESSADARQRKVRHESLQNEVTTLRANLNARMAQLCRDDINLRRKRLREYLANASLGLAQRYDAGR